MNEETPELPCGTDPRSLVAQVYEADPPSAERRAHQAICRHCRPVLASLESLRHDAELVAADPVGAPPDFLRRVMARVRGSAGAIEVSTQPSGTTTVSEVLVTRVARLVAMEVPTVTFALAELGPRRPAGLTLSIRLVVEYGVALHDVAAAVRERVVGEVARTAGLPVGVVDVLVEELSG